MRRPAKYRPSNFSRARAAASVVVNVTKMRVAVSGLASCATNRLTRLRVRQFKAIVRGGPLAMAMTHTVWSI